MTLRPNVYDEGIVLTAAMRVAAGQLPHRDFYAIYGPAEFYLFAGLFKIFGQSILVERLFDLLLRSLTVATVYTIASQYLRKSITLATTIAAFLWLLGLLSATAGAAVIAVTLLNLISTSLLVPIFTSTLSKRRMFLIGVLAAIAWLFRYDTGVALFGIDAVIVATAIWTRPNGKKLFAFANAFWPCLAGFVAIVLPPLFYFLSVSSIHPFVHDIIIFPSTYYHRARNLPFPGIRPKTLDNFAVYIPIFTILISLFSSLTAIASRRSPHKPASSDQDQRLNAFLFAFALVSLVMYGKGLVRVGTIQLYSATIPSLFLIAVLFQQRFNFRRPFPIVISSLAFLSLFCPAWSAIRELKNVPRDHLAVSQELWSSIRGTISPTTKVWCSTPSPATRGLCFLPTGDDIQATTFIDAHTRPGDKLYVGLAKHDKVFANDNVLYFTAARLPATHWSHFDPDLQNRSDIQEQMIRDLELAKPPYIVLDSEFDQLHEPNDSALSSGVKLLDDYIGNNYRHVQTFGSLSIWQRV